MNIDDLTLGQIKVLSGLFRDKPVTGIQYCIGEKVIIRTYSAGVWYGTLEQKSGDEVVLLNARRLWRWWAKESVSLSSVAKHGIIIEKSKIAPMVAGVWLQAIEIIPASKVCQDSIESAQDEKHS